MCKAETWCVEKPTASPYLAHVLKQTVVYMGYTSDLMGLTFLNFCSCFYFYHAADILAETKTISANFWFCAAQSHYLWRRLLLWERSQFVLQLPVQCPSCLSVHVCSGKPSQGQHELQLTCSFLRVYSRYVVHKN